MWKNYICFSSSGSSIQALKDEVRQKLLFCIYRPFYFNYILSITLASTGNRPFSVLISFNNNATVSNFFLKCRPFQAKHFKKESDTLALLLREIWKKNGRYPVDASVMAKI